MTTQQQINDRLPSPPYALYEKYGFEYDPKAFASSELYKRCVPPGTTGPVYFLALLVQLQAIIVGGSRKVKVTGDHVIEITEFPPMTELWKNLFDNYELWKKPDIQTRWCNQLTIGPFLSYKNAKTFKDAWSNTARGFPTKNAKSTALVHEYNKKMVGTLPLKITLTPYLKEEYFMEAVPTPETIFVPPPHIREKNPTLNAAEQWTINFATGDAVFQLPPVRTLSDLL